MEEIRAHIGATTLAYLSNEAMVAATGQPKGRLCRACFDGTTDPRLLREVRPGEPYSLRQHPEQMTESSYEAAGVSIERGEKAVDLMHSAVEATHGAQVLGNTGGPAAFTLAGYAEPVLASTIDGVGTKVMVSRETGTHASLGVDIVNHCANDVLATGARPLLFLDYVAGGRSTPKPLPGLSGGRRWRAASSASPWSAGRRRRCRGSTRATSTWSARASGCARGARS